MLTELAVQNITRGSEVVLSWTLEHAGTTQQPSSRQCTKTSATNISMHKTTTNWAFFTPVESDDDDDDDFVVTGWKNSHSETSLEKYVELPSCNISSMTSRSHKD